VGEPASEATDLDPSVSPFVHPLRNWPSSPPDCYRGQLTSEFQRQLVQANAGLTREDCDWYHTTSLADRTTVKGQWDLRGHEESYLGGIALHGKRSGPR
jgi:hypothetical protein